MTIETLGIDIAKNVFQLHGVNRAGRPVLTRRVMRDQLLAVVAQIEPCSIAIEACTGAFYRMYSITVSRITSGELLK